jgi:hypothetical protein
MAANTLAKVNNATSLHIDAQYNVILGYITNSLAKSVIFLMKSTMNKVIITLNKPQPKTQY